MAKLVVKKHRPLEVILYCLVLSIGISIVVWFFLDASFWNSTKGRHERGQEAKTLWQENLNLVTENQQLREKVIMLKRLMKLDEATTSELQNEIRRLQDQVYDLNSELEFYLDIMSSATNSKGLNIQGLRVEKAEKSSLFRYKLILTNIAKSDSIIHVDYDIQVEGINGSDSQILSLQEIKIGSSLKQTQSFRNFELIEGSFSLPHAFKPLRVVVEINQKGVSNSSVQRVFEWAEIAG